ncbi:serine--tRNA ligase [Candidatus Bathyarchaeota archaeon]|nr:serine--tRNA ligase [Candidatus Bathyarchaeota archaeon]NIU81290.1 serine--tRNA ligase [Candidatus Bathyarchaeota archaeon]NIV67925.1 serine--tRNA ligase [Candidatus Bathyarchaeota archaeon]NIW16366.1 serine--tRNA ligase [Candidatus Bathyarchaeota archaeon]
MLDINLIRDHPEVVRENLKKRGEAEKLSMLEDLIQYDQKWRRSLTELNNLRHKKNVMTTEIAQLKKEGKDVGQKIQQVGEIAENIEELEGKVDKYEEKIDHTMLRLPNILHQSVPLGEDENDNVEVRVWGEPPQLDFEPKSHLEIASDLGLIDGERAARAAGAGFYYLKGELVLLDLAIQRFAIDSLIEKGFTLIEPPLMISERAYQGMSGDPFDFREASYKVEGAQFYLIPTAEYPLGSMFMEEVFPKKELPTRLVGVSACFRREVGTHGKYTKGLFRTHQFNKVEQFIFCLPEQSWDLLEELQRNSEELYQKLGLHHRVVNLCSGDMTTKAAKAYDIEIWMADGEFRECGTNSNCTEYQARRLNIRYREKEGQAPAGYVHTLNNTALATSRTMIGILEQFQQEDGSVIIPQVLRPYMDGMQRIG